MTTMTRTPTPKRPSGAHQGTSAIKALVMVGSIAMTLGGWGILAVGQVQDAIAGPTVQAASENSAGAVQAPAPRQANPAQPQPRQVNPPAVQSQKVNPPAGSQLRQVNPAPAQPRPSARTRSSRYG